MEDLERLTFQHFSTLGLQVRSENDEQGTFGGRQMQGFLL